MDADAYADSSFLVSLFRADSCHHEASAFMKENELSLAYTPLHRIEVRNALRNAVSCGDLKNAERNLAFRQIEEDLKDGLLIHMPVNWTDVFRCADELSEKHSAKEGQRTIDLLHIAIAIENEAKTFLTFDKRQRGLAKSVGLKVQP